MSRARPKACIIALAVLASWLAGCTVTEQAATRPAAPPNGSAESRPQWAPRPGLTWQWQLSGRLDVSVPAQVYDVDLFDTSADQVRHLHALGRKVICYLDVGSYEPDRPDSAKYPRALLGRPLDGWPNERWLDIRRLDLLGPLIAARMDLCAAKGFDGVEPDNADGFSNDTGFPLTAAEQGRFNTRVAELATDMGWPSASRTTSTKSRSCNPRSTSPSTSSACSTTSAPHCRRSSVPERLCSTSNTTCRWHASARSLVHSDSAR